MAKIQEQRSASDKIKSRQARFQLRVRNCRQPWHWSPSGPVSLPLSVRTVSIHLRGRRSPSVTKARVLARVKPRADPGRFDPKESAETNDEDHEKEENDDGDGGDGTVARGPQSRFTTARCLYDALSRPPRATISSSTLNFLHEATASRVSSRRSFPRNAAVSFIAILWDDNAFRYGLLGEMLD